MPDDVALVVAWCRQAKRRGALDGDLCLAQEYAELIAEHDFARQDAIKSHVIIEKIDDVFEAWLSMEHHDVWVSMQNQRAAERQMQKAVDVNSFSDETMDGLLAKLRAAAL